MFDKEDFELTMENQLQLRLFSDTIKATEDVSALQEITIALKKSEMLFQNMLTKRIQNDLMAGLTDWVAELNKEE